MTIYVLENDWDWSEGAQADVVGVYSTKELAHQKMEDLIADDLENFDIDEDDDNYEIEIGETYSSITEVNDYRYDNYNIYERELDE